MPTLFTRSVLSGLALSLCASLAFACERKSEAPAPAAKSAEDVVNTGAVSGEAVAPSATGTTIDTTGANAGAITIDAGVNNATGATTTGAKASSTVRGGATGTASGNAAGTIDLVPGDSDPSRVTGSASATGTVGGTAGTVQTTGGTRKVKTTIVKEKTPPPQGIGATGGPAGREDLRPEKTGNTP